VGEQARRKEWPRSKFSAKHLRSVKISGTATGDVAPHNTNNSIFFIRRHIEVGTSPSAPGG